MLAHGVRSRFVRPSDGLILAPQVHVPLGTVYLAWHLVRPCERRTSLSTVCALVAFIQISKNAALATNHTHQTIVVGNQG